MHFIGICIDNKNEFKVNRILQHKLKNKKLTIININEENIENIKNVKFQTILIMKNIIKKQKHIQLLKSIMLNADIIIINADIEENLNMIQNLETPIITYGFNSKSSITTSSVTGDEIILFIQRRLKTLEGNIIEPKEVNILVDKEEIDINNIMGIFVILLIYEEAIDKVQ